MAEVLEVKHNEAARRYEAEVEGQLAVVDYRQAEGQLTLTHTGVPKSLEGRGIGSALVKAVLDDVRARGLEVVPECPFISAYIRRHQEYLPLVEASSREPLRRAD